MEGFCDAKKKCLHKSIQFRKSQTPISWNFVYKSTTENLVRKTQKYTTVACDIKEINLYVKTSKNTSNEMQLISIFTYFETYTNMKS